MKELGMGLATLLVFLILLAALRCYHYFDNDGD